MKDVSERDALVALGGHLIKRHGISIVTRYRRSRRSRTRSRRRDGRRIDKHEQGPPVDPVPPYCGPLILILIQERAIQSSAAPYGLAVGVESIEGYAKLLIVTWTPVGLDSQTVSLDTSEGTGNGYYDANFLTPRLEHRVRAACHRGDFADDADWMTRRRLVMGMEMGSAVCCFIGNQARHDRMSVFLRFIVRSDRSCTMS